MVQSSATQAETSAATKPAPREPLRPSGNKTWESALWIHYPKLSDKPTNPKRLDKRLIEAKRTLATLLPEPPRKDDQPYPLTENQLTLLNTAKTAILIAYLGKVHTVRPSGFLRDYELTSEIVAEATKQTTNVLWPNWEQMLSRYINRSNALPSREEKRQEIPIFRVIDDIIAPRPKESVKRRRRQDEIKKLTHPQPSYSARRSVI